MGDRSARQDARALCSIAVRQAENQVRECLRANLDKLGDGKVVYERHAVIMPTMAGNRSRSDRMELATFCWTSLTMSGIRRQRLADRRVDPRPANAELCARRP